MLRIIAQSIRTSVAELVSNTGKSIVTMLGVVIGIAAVILVVSIGQGAQALVLSQVEDLGTNLVGVLPGKTEEGDYPISILGIVVTTLTYEDAVAVRNTVPHVVGVAAYARGVGPITWHSRSYDTNISGTTADFPLVENGEIATGRFFTFEEERNLSRVVVLGSLVKEELFGESDAVGQRVRIKDHSFEVIGVMKERGTVGLQDYDDQVFIPIRSMQRLIAGVSHIGLLRAKVDHEDNILDVVDGITATLRERHGIEDSTGSSDDFTVRSADEIMDILRTVTDSLGYFLTATAALSLIVGGVGIMNIVLTSVTERTREIGLRKAIGARNRDVLIQFLIESITLTFVSGIVGIVLGILGAFLVSVGVEAFGYDWEFIVTIPSIVVAVVVSAGVGLVFGMYPSYKASQLDPIAALHYE